MQVFIKCKNCIVTGLPAKLWTGIVLMNRGGKKYPVTAGFSSDEHHQQARLTATNTELGMEFGDWKFEDGIEISDWICNQKIVSGEIIKCPKEVDHANQEN